MFKFPVDPQDLFNERATQMQLWGIPQSIISTVRAAVTDNWLEEKGGWVYEWMKHAKKAEGKLNWGLASACYGAARFPVACTPLRKVAQAKQVECYLKASVHFSCDFQRKVLTIPFMGMMTSVPIHIFERKTKKLRPVICLSGGVDTFKMELHRLAVALALIGDFKVVAMDMPGTGESEVALSSEADKVYQEVLQSIASENGKKVKTGVIGLSFGGAWSAKLALRRVVDCAVDIGGPVGFTYLNANFLKDLPNGMPGIIGNTLHLNNYPEDSMADDLLSAFSLKKQGLLKPEIPISSLLVVNGADDQYIPRLESEGFRDFKNADVWIFKNATHCAAEKFPWILPGIIGWLRHQLYPDSYGNRAFNFIAKTLLPPRII